LDSLKLQSIGNASHHLFIRGDTADLREIEQLLRQRDQHGIAAVFTEYPSNPLLTVADLKALYTLCQRYHVPLFIDDTVSSFGSINTLAYCDVTISSLSKWFSGEGDVLAGCITLNTQSQFYTQFKQQLHSVDSRTQLPSYQDTLYRCDAEALEINSRQYMERVEQSLRTTAKLTAYLRAHPLIKNIYTADANAVPSEIRRFKEIDAVTGLFSFELHECINDTIVPSCAVSAAFYDVLRCSKGPSLGTNFTLVCPYTLLAHYNELDWCESIGIPRNLIRVSVGLEDADELIQRFDAALQHATNVYNTQKQQQQKHTLEQLSDAVYDNQQQPQFAFA